MPLNCNQKIEGNAEFCVPFPLVFRIPAEAVIFIVFFFIFPDYVIKQRKKRAVFQEMNIFTTFLSIKCRLVRVIGLCALLFLAVTAFYGSVDGASLYRFVDEDGNVNFTDDPSDPRYKYTPVKTYESEQKIVKPEKVEESKPGTTKAAPGVQPRKEELGGKEGMIKKIEELGKARDAATNERQRKMLESEIQGLKQLLEDYDKADKDWSG